MSTHLNLRDVLAATIALGSIETANAQAAVQATQQ